MSAEPKPTRPAWLFDGIGIGCGMLIGGFCLCSGLGSVGNFLDWTLMQVFPRSKETDLAFFLSHQKSEAKQLALGLSMYAGDYDDRWPPNLDVVKPYVQHYVPDLSKFRYQVPPYLTTEKTPADYILARLLLADKRTAYIHADFHVTVGLKPD